MNGRDSSSLLIQGIRGFLLQAKKRNESQMDADGHGFLEICGKGGFNPAGEFAVSHQSWMICVNPRRSVVPFSYSGQV
jgi:hypothetical protein